MAAIHDIYTENHWPIPLPLSCLYYSIMGEVRAGRHPL